MKAIATVAELAVELAGAPLSEANAGCLASIQVRQRASAPSQAELTFRGANAAMADTFVLMPGLALVVKDAVHDVVVFDGEVTAVEHDYGPDGALEIRCRGYDRLHRLRKRQTIRVLTDLDCTGLAEELAAGIGMGVDSDVAGERLDRVVQWWQSDLELLTECCRRTGLSFGADGDRLVVFDGTGRGDPVVLRLGDELIEGGFELNGDRTVEAVSATGWDPATGRRFERRAGEARSGRTAGARVAAADLGGSTERVIPNTVATDEAQVAETAQAALDAAVASTAVVRGVALGDARIRPGSKVSVAGVATAFEGEYVVTEASHTVDAARGYLVAFGTGPIEGPGAGGGSVRVVPGLVLDVDDPKRLGRVRVSYPTLPPVESGWLRIVSAAAGPQTGFVAVPSHGDEVLVLLPTGDPSHGLILGGLFTADEPPDFGIESGEVRRYTWRTCEGEEIQLDRERGRVVIRTPNGSRVSLGKGGFSLLSATDLEIAAPGKTIRIRAKAVDFERAAEAEE